MKIKNISAFLIAFVCAISVAAQSNISKTWWTNFNDPTLDSLIYIGQNSNLNLAQALKNVEIARMAVREAKSSYYPQLNLGLGWNRTGTSAFTTLQEGVAMTESYFSLGLNMNWEIDLFGRITSKVKEAKGAYNASKEDYDWMCVTIAAEIATYYMDLRTLQQEFKVTSEHVEQQQQVLKITEARYDAGLASKLDVAQARTVFYSTKASLCNLQTQIITDINAIAVLTARYPSEMQEWLAVPSPQPNPTWVMNVELNPEALRNRPDVKEAEFMVEEDAAALGYEKKQWLPSLSLSASVGTEAWHIKDLFRKHSFTYSIAPQLTWTIFDGFARDAEIASAKEKLMASVDNYNLTLITAIQEVDNALTSYTKAVEYEKEIATVLENARLAYTLALDRYRQGLDAFINVSDAQITVLQYANELVAARGNVLTSLVALQKSLCL